MKFAVAALLAATGAMAYPSNGTVIVTEVVESYVTYCPSPTTITYGSSTITVTEPTTITITDCPCTITKPIITTTLSVCHECPEPEVPTEVPEVPTFIPSGNATIPTIPPTVPVPEPTVPAPEEPEVPGVPTTTPPPTGAAAKVGFSGLAGLALVAALL